jgi:hypothetical protein
MSETNFDSKLQKTITMMQEINQLMSDAESQSQIHKDESSTKESILSLKQNILNQHETNFSEAFSLLENPPKILVDMEGTKVEIIDQEAYKELKQNFTIANTNLELSKSNYSEAKLDAVFARNQLVEKDQVKNLLESERDQLYNQMSSLLATVRLETKSALKNMDKDKDLVKETREIDDNSKNKLFFNDNDDQNHYFKGNLQVTDFNKVLESSPTKTSHMSIEAVNDN